jgi:Tfp pilus assembly protein PilF
VLAVMRTRLGSMGSLLLAFGLCANAGCLTSGTTAKLETPPEPAPGNAELPPAKSAEVLVKLAENMENAGHDADAIVCYERARQADPKLPNIARRLAPIYDRVGESKRALEEYQIALKASPRDANLLNNFGYYYYTRGQWHEAEATFRQALAVNPGLARAWTNLGLTLGEQGRNEECLQAFAKAGLSQAEALSNLGFVLTTQGKRDEARRAYTEALRLDPNLRIARGALQKLDAPAARPTDVTAANAVAIPAIRHDLP